ncbi:MAG: SH3 domain-containing protein [Hyphomicrobiales bacterium]
MPFPQVRLAFAGLLVALAAVLFVDRTPAHAAPPPADYDGIAAVALSYDGQWGGQCWTFMQQVVFEATGKQVGFDYREGFFEAGAIEVSVADARTGDIIQIADDANTAPDADYPGLHTAIVLDNHGDGTFRVVDSNANWDEMVSVRDNYDPAAAAARNGLNFHIYRIEAGDADPAPAGGRVGSGGLTTIRVGDPVHVSAQGDCLNLRKSPGITSAIIDCLADGTKLTVTEGPVEKGGRLWIRVSSPVGEGWVAAQYLSKDASAVPASGGDGSSRPILKFRTVLPAISNGD